MVINIPLPCQYCFCSVYFVQITDHLTDHLFSEYLFFCVFVYACVLFLVFSEVSCKTLEGFDGLKMLIYQVVLSMKDNSSLACGGKLLGRLVSKLIM